MDGKKNSLYITSSYIVKISQHNLQLDFSWMYNHPIKSLPFPIYTLYI